MKRHPAVHHNENKLCVISFRYKGEFKSLKGQRFKDRQSALTYIKSYYRGASQISIVFYVPQNKTGESQNETV